MRDHPRATLLALFLALCWVAPSEAAWPAGEIVICDDPGVQVFLEVRADGTGGMVMTWLDWRRNLSFPDFYAQRVDADGVAQWGANGRSYGQWSGDRWEMDSDGAGGFGYTWDAPSGIMAWHVDSTGAPDWDVLGLGLPSPVEVSGAAGLAPQNPIIVSDAAGGFFIVWGDNRDGLGANFYAQHLDPNGFELWTTGGVPATVGTAIYVFPAFSASATGNLRFVYLDQSTGGQLVRIQQLSSTGARLLGDRGLLLSSPLAFATGPKIIDDGIGGVYVLWGESFANSSDDRVKVMHLDASGAPTWPQTVEITPGDAAGDYCLMPDGGLLMAWHGNGISTQDLYATWLAPDGSYVWPNGSWGVPVSANQSTHNRSAVITDANGEIWVTWTDNRSGSFYGYYQHLDQTGQTLGTPDGDLLGSGRMSWAADLVRTPSGVVAVYRDYRNGSPDIFASLLGGGPATAAPIVDDDLILKASHPSPFTSRTTIGYALSRPQFVELSVFDLRGRRVRTLVSSNLKPGRHEARWDGRDDHGRSLASGVYVVRLRGSGVTRSARVVLVR